VTQVPSYKVSVEEVMRTSSFAAGVNDVRRRVPPRFDDPKMANDIDKQWDYERGRLWATIAPPSLALRLGGKLNPKAIALFEKRSRAFP
jgi:hypothetical protein